MTPITFFVQGVPRPAGSKSAFVLTNKKTGQPFRSKTGRMVVNMADASKHGKQWKRTVAMIARAVYKLPPLTFPLSVSMVFFMPRIKAHFHTRKADAGKLREDAPKFHTSKPDATKLVRGTEDALTGMLWKDDAQIAIQHVMKIYADGPTGCEITISEATTP